MYYVFEMTYIKFISMLVYKYFVAKLVIILVFFVPFFSLSTHTFMKNKQPFQLRERERVLLLAGGMKKRKRRMIHFCF